MPYVPPDDELAAARRKYYAQHPDQDPQSLYSRILEYFGADEPYQNNSTSYDYRKRVHGDYFTNKDHPDYGNPDVSWLLPEVPEQNQIDQGVANFEDGQYAADPRTEEERNAGAILDALSWPSLGFQDEAIAGVMSAVPGRDNYDQELAKARRIQKLYEEYEPIGVRSIASTVGGLALSGPEFIALQALGGKALRAGRKLAGYAPEATTRAGRIAGEATAGAGAGTALFSGYDVGEAEGDLPNRLKNISPEGAASGAIFGAIGMRPIAKAAKAIGAGEMVGTKVIPRRKMRKVGDPPLLPPGSDKKFIPGHAPDMNKPPRNVQPQEPTTLLPKKARPQSSVRDDIEQAMRRKK